ncbi:DNA-processing protein DprA [Fictibacillus barbaricus]|uniref:DNA processing protein n=1 Tax=Fictibacillus barbaricus TaxID=182136 RepID=A0ABU1U514_9BACL|nr:DNA-processing protein DprA [Fictibacillus barbaricus]MDR7074553.1 DNA processing protein [Fictibacillus barbaricus]
MDKERLIFLHHCEGLSWQHLNKIITADPDLKRIFTMSANEMMVNFSFSEQIAKRLHYHVNHQSIFYIMKELKKYSIKAVTFFDEDYPASLRSIFDPPWVLYGKGDMRLLEHKNILSVVGTRTPSHQGRDALKKVILPLIQDSWIVVSGLARGIDTFAHDLCIRNGSFTAAVLGSGLECIYPKENGKLAEQISKQGILLSEFPPNTQPRRWHFPLRNRIISGLSKATLVAEARTKSGSLITADQALEQGRDVFAIPGSILQECSAGTNYLIQNGAKLVMCADDILHEW